jgi:hypothetical protein
MGKQKGAGKRAFPAQGTGGFEAARGARAYVRKNGRKKGMFEISENDATVGKILHGYIVTIPFYWVVKYGVPLQTYAFTIYGEQNCS